MNPDFYPEHAMPVSELERVYELLMEALETGGDDPSIFQKYQDMIRKALAYAACRSFWNLHTYSEKAELDMERTMMHNDFIAAKNALAKAMEEKGLSAFWADKLGNDRKDVGDFACFLAFIEGVNAR